MRLDRILHEGIGRPRDDRGRIQDVGLRLPQIPRKKGETLAGPRLEPGEKGAALSKEVTGATDAGVKPR
jgi:hypothetical protein